MAHTILLADDSPTIQRLVSQTFDEGHLSVVTVSNGEAAVRRFEEVRPSIVLADVYMPGKNGYEVCSFVKAHPVLGTTPVILLVGAFEVFEEEEAKRVGADEVVKKPFEPQELFELVSGLVEGRVQPVPPGVEDDILGLTELFPLADAPPERPVLSGKEIDEIADRVIQRLSKDVIEGIAWEVVPGIADRVVHEELERRDED